MSNMASPASANSVAENEVNNIANVFRAFFCDESGQDLIEYALVAGLIGLGAVVAMSSVKTSLQAAFNSVSSQLTNAL